MDISEGYLDYDDYKDLGGTLAEMPFTLLEYEARKEIDKYTYGRLKELDEQVEEVKLCDYKLINLLLSYQSIDESDKAISSESTDGYSVSYNKVSSDDMQVREKKIKNIIYTYLSSCKLSDGTPYLYRGVEC